MSTVAVHTTAVHQNPRFSEAALARVKELISHYPEGRQKSALLPVLHLAQEEFSWLSVPVMDYVASLLSIRPIEVYEVASFYSMYNLKPVGRYKLEICRTGPCCLRGAEDLMGHLEAKLGIKMGETTPDGLFTLVGVECLGSCGTAPMLQLGEQFHENLTLEKADALLEELRRRAV